MPGQSRSAISCTEGWCSAATTARICSWEGCDKGTSYRPPRRCGSRSTATALRMGVAHQFCGPHRHGPRLADLVPVDAFADHPHKALGLIEVAATEGAGGLK